MVYIKGVMIIYMYTMPRENWDEQNPGKQAIRTLIIKHHREMARPDKLMKYYEGQYKILSEGRKTKLVCNHVKDISDITNSYFIGNPISYKSSNDISVLMDAFEQAGTDEVDGDNGLSLSIYGRVYECIYPEEGETGLIVKNLSPENTFMVYGDTIEQKELFAIYYYVRKDDSDRKRTIYVATVLTEHLEWALNIENTDSPQALLEEPAGHFFDGIPVVEHMNNRLATGDFELQIPLTDAYNALMSDRITDKEQSIDTILAIHGAILGDPEAEDKDGKTVKEKVKGDKLLELPKDSGAEYLTRTSDESGVEILKKAIEQDVHKFSHIFCMTDESFGGNVPGVAMEFKLLGMENTIKIKTRYYKKGLWKRLRLLTGRLNKSKAIAVDVFGITPTFSRVLPKNPLEISQTIANLWGKVSRKVLLSQVPFVDDVDAELAAVEKESREALKQQQAMFGIGSNTPPDISNDSPSDGDVDEWFVMLGMPEGTEGV